MTELCSGANAPLGPGGAVEVRLEWARTPSELDIACFLVREDGKVPSDAWMVFYNQREAPGGVVRFEPGGGHDATFAVQLDRVPGDIRKCVFTATLDGPGTFAQVEGLSARATTAGQPAISYALSGVSQERAVILWEIYRHPSGWKIRAVGQGFNGGLEPLARSLGVVVENDPPPERPAPPPPPPPGPVRLAKVVLTKPNEAAKVSLVKKADGRIEHIKVTMRWTAAVDLDLHAFYKTRDGKLGHVYFARKGSLAAAPQIQLDQDAGVGARAGRNEENLTVASLQHVEAVLFAVNIFRLIGRKDDNFARYDGRVVVRTSQGEVEVPLTSAEKGRWAIIAKLDCRGEPQVININRVQKDEPTLESF